MLFMLMTLSLMNSMIMTLLKHPMSMGMTLLIQTLLTSMMLGFFNLNYWYSYILFLIMIGGMMVLFIYMTSVASNEKFKQSLKIMLLMWMVALLIMMTMSMMDSYMINTNNINKEKILHPLYTLSMNKFLTLPFMMVLIMLMLYLLMTLIAIVKITNIKNGPLRQMN